MNEGYQIKLFNTWQTGAHKLINSSKEGEFEFPLLKNEQFLALMDQAPSVVFIINHAKSTYEFFSKNVFSVLGYSAEEMCDGGVAFGVSLLEEPHAKLYSEHVIPLLFEKMKYYSELNELKNIRLSYSFRSRRKDGSFMWQLHQMTVLETNENGGALLSMVFLTDLENIKKDEHVDFSISKKDETGVYKVVFVTSFAKDAAKVSLSNRELQIVDLISKGLSTKQISEKLYISSHTVSTHRKNILSKFKSVDESDLVNILKTKGIAEIY